MRDNTTDLATAIQLMARHEAHAMSVGDWVEILEDELRPASGGGNQLLRRLTWPARVRSWTLLFRSYPEIFHFDRIKGTVSLVARTRGPRLYHMDLKRKITLEEFMNLPHTEKQERVTRAPLREDEISELMQGVWGELRRD